MPRLDMSLLISNETENYCSLRDSIRTKGSQQGDIETDRFIEHGKHIGWG